MQRKDIVKQTDLIISEIELPPDSEPIWHWHTQIQETVYCLEGQLLVLGMRQPVEQTLGLGENSTSRHNKSMRLVMSVENLFDTY